MKEREPRKESLPVILWDNITQHAIWEIVLKNELDGGFWAKSRIDKTPYLIAKSAPFPKLQGTTIVPALTSFDFGSNEFLAEQGYYVAIVMKLVENFKQLNTKELNQLAVFSESMVLVDFLDDNSDYRRIQVAKITVDERNVPKEYKETLRGTVNYFENKGISIDDIVRVLKDNPYKKPQIRKVLYRMSEILKKRISHEEILRLSKS